MFAWDAYGYMQYQSRGRYFSKNFEKTFLKIWDTTQNKRATNGFLSQLLKSWLEDGAAHDAEIIFFARHIYQTEDMKYPEDVGQNFPPEWRHLIQVTKKRRYYVKISAF